MGDRIKVYVEAGRSRVFASATDWPGWSRAARDEAGALAALATYAPRYAVVIAEARRDHEDGPVPSFPAGVSVEEMEVVARPPGGSGTDFGVPSATVVADDDPVTEQELATWQRILRACWETFDRAAAAAGGIELTKGPRGGGRDLDKIVMHALEADEAYVSQLGQRIRRAPGAVLQAWAGARELALEVLTVRARDDEPPSPNNVRKRWSPRYYVRRAAWHVLDHAWEIEDRSGQANP
jgi:hypothetical protein